MTLWKYATSWLFRTENKRFEKKIAHVLSKGHGGALKKKKNRKTFHETAFCVNHLVILAINQLNAQILVL